ncbi:hypothetical protein [uncultured Bacteroides sp.]|uniref:HU family DNA-binding protein n=1 Tax=uncultured Bacteroides sp. TaxID=162156 RepID=UPI0015B0EBD4|nr:hypothetical protein [uncultured Bacteroides sp.]
MEAQYDFLPVPGTKNEDKNPKLYPKLVTRGAVPFSEIIRQIARSSGFKEGTVIGVMEEVEKWTAYYIARGESVEIGHMAYAVANLKAEKEVTDENGIHAQNICFDKVRFRTAKSFNQRCRGQQLSRAKAGWKFQQSSARYTEQERLDLVMEYLTQYPFITRTKYGELTGLQKSKAWKDLSKWVKEKKLDTQGRAPHKIYVLPTGQLISTADGGSGSAPDTTPTENLPPAR